MLNKDIKHITPLPDKLSAEDRSFDKELAL